MWLLKKEPFQLIHFLLTIQKQAALKFTNEFS